MKPELAAGHEATQRRSLRRHRMVATGLLLAMAAIFLAARAVESPDRWVLLVRAAAEAALVGGLADWFAVTALFRRPLGLPIPHTAILPRNKDRIGEGIGAFIERNFLAPDLVVGKLRSIDPAARLSGWLRAPGNADAVAERAASAVPYLLHVLEDQDVRRFLRGALDEQLRAVDLAPVLGKGLAVLTESGHHQALFDQGLRVAGRLIGENEERICRMVAERSRWWIPKAIDLRIAQAIIAGVKDFLAKLAEPGHEFRLRLDQAVADIVDKLQHSPDYQAKIATLKEQILSSPAVQDYLESLWDEVRRVVAADALSPSSRLRQILAGSLQSLGAALAADPVMQERVNRSVERFVMRSIVPWRAEIGRFIAEVVRGWDGRTMAERIELAVGADLQYIRINGTVVGALVGCLLFLLSELLP